jgi:hypothetical protein
MPWRSLGSRQCSDSKRRSLEHQCVPSTTSGTVPDREPRASVPHGDFICQLGRNPLGDEPPPVIAPRIIHGRTLGPSPGYRPGDEMTSCAGIRCRPPGGRLLPSPHGLPPPAEEPDIMAMPTRETAVTTIEELLALPSLFSGPEVHAPPIYAFYFARALSTRSRIISARRVRRAISVAARVTASA